MQKMQKDVIELPNLKRFICIAFLVVVVFIFSLSTTIICDDDVWTRGGVFAPTPMGMNCQIYSLDREEFYGGPRWLACNPETDEIKLISSPCSWRITKINENPDIYTFEYKSDGEARLLRVNPEGGWVELGTSDKKGDYTKWSLKKISNNPPIYRIQTYKEVANRWLFGCVDDGRVGLSKNKNYMFSDYNIFNSDTSWQIEDRYGNALDL